MNMWIRTINGTKYAQERQIDPITGKVHTLSLKVEGAGKKAEKVAMRTLEQRLNVKKVTEKRLSDCVRLYLKAQEAVVKPSTLRRNGASLRRLVGILGDPYIERTTAGYVREKLIETGRGPATANEYLRRLKSCLRWCVANDIVDTDLPEKLANFHDSSHRAKIADKYLEPEEISRLIDGMDILKYRLLTEFLVLSGLRIGEALALDLEDLDTDIHVRHTVDPMSGELTSTKTMTSSRDVFIQPELATVLKQIRAWRLEQMLYCGYEPVTHLFPDENGRRIQYAAYKKYLQETSVRTIGRSISPHTLRHSHCSLLAASGIGFDAIARRLGHSDSKITREIYFHVTKKLKAADDAAMSRVTLLS